MKDYEKLHPGRTLVPLDVADQELADGVFDLSNVFPEQLKKLVSDMRASRATWSGITFYVSGEFCGVCKMVTTMLKYVEPSRTILSGLDEIKWSFGPL